MPNKKTMQDLVEAHKELEEPISGAIWIRKSDFGAWLVEVLPEMPDDSRVLDPVVFSPTTDFRYSLHLIAGNLRSLQDALHSNPEMAREVASGEVLFADNDCEDLMRMVREVAES